MVDEERASTSTELRLPTGGEVDDEHVATTSGTGATVEALSAPAKLRWGEEAGPHGSTLAEGSGASAGVQAGASEQSEAEANECEGKSEIDGEKTRRYSIDEFGRILQNSQWSLSHRIIVCKVLECNPSIMTPLSRQEYAKQSLALVDRQDGIIVKDISASDWLSFEEMSSSVKKELDQSIEELDTYSSLTERLHWKKYFTELRKKMMGHVFGDWKKLRERLEEKLVSSREEDARKEWYTRAFNGKDIGWKPWKIYALIEKGHLETVHEMMAKIGVEQWGKLKPREYRGATPLHWAALHNQVDHSLRMLMFSDPWPMELFDDFGFKPVHMAIFASSFLLESLNIKEDIYRCFDNIGGYAAILTSDQMSNPCNLESKLFDIVTWGLRHEFRTKGWNFLVCPLTWSTTEGKWIESTGTKDNRIQSGCGNDNNEKFFVFKLVEEKGTGTREGVLEYTFLAKCYFSTSIHPLHLAIWIGHPLVVEKLIHAFEGMRHFSRVTEDGDTVLHLAFKAMDFGRKSSACGSESWSGPNFDDWIWSEGYVAQSMTYASRERVMTIMMRYLHFYPHMLNSQNKDGQTPLHIAIFQGNLPCVRALLRYDYVNCNIKNKKGVTPIDMVLKLDAKDSKLQRMYANILGRECTVSEEVGFTTIMCNDVWYFGEYGAIIDHMMEELDSDIVRKRRILQLSQWSDKHRIYALQMLDENPVGMANVKDTYIKQCDLKLLDHGAERWAESAVKQSVEISQQLEILKFRFIIETSRQHGHSQFEDEQNIFAHIEDGADQSVFRVASRLETPSRNYKWANPLHWAILHGKWEILDFIPRYMYDSATRTKIVDVTDGFGFTFIHFALFYSFSRRLNHRYKPFLHSDKRFTSRYEKGLDLFRNRDENTYSKMIDKLHEMGFSYTGLMQGSWRDGCGDFVLWSITSTDVIHVDNSLTPTRFHPIHLAVHCAQPKNFKRLLECTPAEAWADSNVDTGDTILHNAEGWEVLMRQPFSKDERRKTEFTLLKKLHDLKAVNSRNWKRETPLHRAVRAKTPKWAEVLLQFEHLRFNLRDQDIRTPGDLAAEMLREKPTDKRAQKIVDLLDCYDPESWPRKKEMEQKKIEEERKREKDDEKKRREDKFEAEKLVEQERKKRREEKLEAEKRVEQQRKENRVKKLEAEEERKNERDAEKKRKEKQLEDEKQIEDERKITEGLQRERQVYVDAGNAILVGGALIGSASFGAWLQPPLGLHPYYSPEFLDTNAPPALGPIYDSYVAIQQHWTIHAFWILNSLSFFFSLATVIAGADAALPREGLDVQEALDSVKRAVKIEAGLLIVSILFVIGTFATVGFTVLPPISKYRVNMICTVVIGGLACLAILIKLLRKLCCSGKTLGRASLPHQATTQPGPGAAQPGPAAP